MTRRKKKKKLYIQKQFPAVHSLFFIFWFSLMSAAGVLALWQTVTADQTVYTAVTGLRHKALIRTIRARAMPHKPTVPSTVKGIYLTARSAGSGNVDAFVDFITRTELNAVVIDIKDYSGWIAYDSDVPLADELQTERVYIKDMPGLLLMLHERGIYAIARIQVFQDPVLARVRPDLAIYDSVTGKPWRDWKGLAWLDPYSTEVWDYIIALARDAIAQGFDEVNFDYVRFPSDGPIAQARYVHADGSTKIEAINNFFTHLSNALKDEPAYISVDLFGMTLWNDSDFNIGQTLLGAAPYFDYISPMVYPSHYPRGFDGFVNPAEHPYEIVYRNLVHGSMQLASSTAKLRPWLQDFNLGAVYTQDMVRVQIRAAEENKTSGWLLWNASNRYTEEALLGSIE